MRSCVRFLLIGALLLSVVVHCSVPSDDEKELLDASSKKVQIMMKPRWGETPLSMEAAEFFSSSENQFWKFVEAFQPQQTAKAEYEHILQIGRRMFGSYSKKLGIFAEKLFKYGLSLRYYSPAVASFHQIANETWFENTGLYIQMQKKQDCPWWFVVDGRRQIFCDLEHYIQHANSLLMPNDDLFRQTIYTKDHVFGPFVQNRKTLILHASLSHPTFSAVDSRLRQLAEKGGINYVLRLFDWGHFEAAPMLMQGYGVELAIKNTEYPVVDDSFSPEDKVPFEYSGPEISSSDKTNLDGFLINNILDNWSKQRSMLFSIYQNQTFKDLDENQLKSIGTQTIQAILKASDPLLSLQTISQNYPALASVLSALPVEQSISQQLRQHQAMFGDGNSYLLMNERHLDLDDLNPHSLYSFLMSEFGFIRKLDSIGLPARLLPAVSKKLKEFSAKPFAYRVDARSSAVVFLNNLETDRMYARWSKSVKELLEPGMPGMPHFIAKNLYTLVLVVDPFDEATLQIYAEMYQYLTRNAPIRVGFVLSMPSEFDSEDSRLLHRGIDSSFRYLASKLGAGALALFEGIWHTGRESPEDPIDIGVLEKGYNFVVDNLGRGRKLKPFSEVMTEAAGPLDPEIESSDEYIARLDIKSFPTIFFNGQPLAGHEALSQLNLLFHQEESLLADHVRKGSLTDSMDIYDFLLTQPGVFARINSRIIPTGEAGKSLPFISIPDIVRHEQAASLSLNDIQSLSYLVDSSDSQKLSTTFICSDLGSAEAIASALIVVQELDETSRVAFLPIQTPSPVLKTVTNIIHSFPVEEVKSVLADYLAEVQSNKNQNLADEALSALFDGRKKLLQDDEQSNLHRKVAGVASSEFSLITNGRGYEFGSHVSPMFEVLQEYWAEDDEQPSLQQAADAVMFLSSIVWSTDLGRRESLEPAEYPEIMYETVGSLGINVFAVVNPLSRFAQKASEVLMLFRDYFDVNIKIFWNPSLQVASTPLKSFYRFVLEPELLFDAEGRLQQHQVATFEDMPEHKTLTMGIDTMEAWMVGLAETKYDLDNIILKDLPPGIGAVVASLELENILITGNCYDQTNQPPRGLQLHLGSLSQSHLKDTIIMANLGYFQLQANPGAFILSLAPGKSRDLFTISSKLDAKLIDAPKNAQPKTEFPIILDSFLGLDVKLDAEKKKDKMKVGLLDDGEATDGHDETGLWGKINNLFAPQTSHNTSETIHIFSVASGHLYERFLRIMMFSVVKNTKNPVKFWLLKNYLSPRFKHYLPAFAAKHNFQYELITYKWPHFLNKQTEKHRVIWGSKVLFLDVLFPLDVEKIIFVDADQVARSDLADLYFMDIQDKPLAYTPFCKSRPEMHGYQFWNGGFWASHLRGKPYHISALYVVDLKKFRKMAAGDRFRITYEQLSRDPNSLSNLDQDLPNYMQHQVPIFSLPQDWLWCESWCSNNDKPNAKTIDLCNNPETKEPKLESAKRIISEWTSYDDALSGIERDLLSKHE